MDSQFRTDSHNNILTRTMHNGSRRLLHCFSVDRKGDDDDDDGGSVRSFRSHRTDELSDGNSVVSMYDAIEEPEGVVFDNNNNNNNNNVKGQTDIVPSKKKTGHWRFSRVLKAVWFETSLGKKIRKRKRKLKMLTKSEKPPSDQNNSLEDENGTIIFNNSSSSGSSSAITSSSNSSSFSSNNARCLSDRNKSFGLNSFETKQMNIRDHGKGCYSPHIGLCFLLISLFILVFWGKVCAILCSSTWLFFVPRWKMGNTSFDSAKIDSGEYKKKIVSEGLLERN